MSGSINPRYHLSAQVPLLIGSLAFGALFIAIGVWSITTRFSGAVVAQGQLVVEDNRQVVQHLEGGIVAEVLVRNGDVVTAGEQLVELDTTQLLAELQDIQTQLSELTARETRYEAEISRPNKPQLLHFKADESEVLPNTMHLFDVQQALFITRIEARERETKTNNQRISLLRQQIIGIDTQKEAASTQADILEAELKAQSQLLDRGLTQSIRVTELARDHARHMGDIGRLSANIAHLQSEIEVLTLENARLRSSMREDALFALQDLRPRKVALEQRVIVLLARLRRASIVSPVDGVVHATAVFGPESVILPAQELMFVIRNDSTLLVSARVSSVDADQVYIGQPATLRFTSLDLRLSPEILGRITHVSAEAIENSTTGSSYFEVEVAPNEDELRRLDSEVLRPGMPVEVFAQSAARTPLSYATRPIRDYFARAWRDG